MHGRHMPSLVRGLVPHPREQHPGICGWTHGIATLGGAWTPTDAFVGGLAAPPPAGSLPTFRQGLGTRPPAQTRPGLVPLYGSGTFCSFLVCLFVSRGRPRGVSVPVLAEWCSPGARAPALPQEPLGASPRCSWSKRRSLYLIGFGFRLFVSMKGLMEAGFLEPV